MALIVENGSIVTNANSYVTDVEFTAYADSRGYSYPATEAERDILLIRATDYINSTECNMQGVRTSSDQELAYPRYSVWLHGYLLESDVIPTELKKAQMEYAIASQTIDLFTNENVSNVQKEKLDTMEVSYFKGGKSAKLRIDSAMTWLKPLLKDAKKLVRT